MGAFPEAWRHQPRSFASQRRAAAVTIVSYGLLTNGKEKELLAAAILAAEFKVAIADEGAPPKHSGSHSKPRSEGASASGRRDQSRGTRRQGHWVRGLEASSAPLDAVEG